MHARPHAKVRSRCLPAHSIFCCVVHLAVVDMCIWSHSRSHVRLQHPVSRLTKALPHVCVLHSAFTEPCAILWLYPAGDIVVVARGSSAKPVVERVPLPAIAAEPASIRLKPQQVKLSWLDTALFAADPSLES